VVSAQLCDGEVEVDADLVLLRTFVDVTLRVARNDTVFVVLRSSDSVADKTVDNDGVNVPLDGVRILELEFL